MFKKIHTFWLLFLAAFTVLDVSIRAIVRSLFGKLNRPWIDKTMQNWATRILRIVHIKYVTINPHNVKINPNKTTIIMCNHSSHFDIPLSVKAFPDASLRMLAKIEIAKIPLMGKAMKVAEFPFIDRKDRAKAIVSLKKVQDLLASGIVMWIAPEGTRSLNGQLGSFKKGGFITAIQAGAEIIPLGIRGAWDILPAKTLDLKLDQLAELHIGEPIDATQYTLENKEELIAKVHAAIKQLAGETS